MMSVLCVNYDSFSILSPCPIHVNLGVDPWSKNYSLRSRDKMNLPNFYTNCIKEYLPYQNWLFQMYTIVFVSLAIFNI